MSDFQKTLDDIFVEKLGYEYDRIECIIPEIADSENILSYRREYVGINVNIIIVECRDRRPEFQKEFIRKEKDKFPNSYFLFVCNDGKVIDLYNDATSKNLKKITYDEISLNTSLFKEKIRLFNVERAENGTELQINAEKAFETNDKVAKSFFDKFQKIHKKLRSAITGITDEKDLSWYASVLMNRFMFIYFLQKHNVIQDNPNYLLDQFAEVTKKAKDYYHDFLLPLFFYGFARKDTNPAKRMFTAEYGDIRYLNGGLFYPHIVEKKYTPTDVSVEYYEEKAIKTAINVNARKVREVLEFLNGYTWYLDQRPMKKDTDINPNVLGYIFEKYINQKELGAYYTKEDITEYIAKNTIIPFIFDKMKSNGYNAPDASPLITDNEDIIAAADSYIASISNYGQLKFLYKDVLNELSVLDPSVGSGAFLFAALNVLLPIYQKVVFMLRKFTDSANDKWLTEQLALIDKRKEEYFLTKQIILNNLYGVDIVQEAVEICKLRLFLQLVSHISDIKLIEPLPDIDFNIYAGNSLAGGLSWEDLLGNYIMDVYISNNREQIQNDIDQLGLLKAEFRKQQRLSDKEDELDVIKDNILTIENRVNNDLKIGIDNPFHWFVDFHNIMAKGGFDVIIGNPPYVEYSKVKKEYTLRNYKTINCGNLYANFIERSLKILKPNSKIGLIVPISFCSTKRMEELQNVLYRRAEESWISSYGERPSKLFEGAEVSLNIILSSLIEKTEDYKIYTTRYNKWNAEERSNLFKQLQYIESSELKNNYSIPKIGNKIEKSILEKIRKKTNLVIKDISSIRTAHILSYRNAGGRYYKIFLPFEPLFSLNGVNTTSSTSKSMFFKDESLRDAYCAIFNSSLFFLYWTIYSDTWHLVGNEINTFRVPNVEDLYKLSELGREIANSFVKHSTDKEEKRNKGKDTVKIKKYFGRQSKDLIDKIDCRLAEFYDFSTEELSYIINYDIKLRIDE